MTYDQRLPYKRHNPNKPPHADDRTPDAGIRRYARVPVKDLETLNTWIDGVRVDTVRLSHSSSRIDPLWITFETASVAIDIEFSLSDLMDLAQAIDEMAGSPIPDERKNGRARRTRDD
jgi:hypothetical protein